MFNEGQITPEMQPGESGADINSLFQVAKVSRPLWAVSQMTDSDLEVLFTKTHAVLRDPRRGGKVIARAERRNGLYRSRMRVRNPRYKGPPPGRSAAKPKGFGRQGTRK